MWTKERDWDLGKFGRLCLFCTIKDFEFGFGFTLPGEGRAMPGLVTLRPCSASVMIGPWTLYWEAIGRADVYVN